MRTGTSAAEHLEQNRVHVAVTIDGQMRGMLVRQTMPELGEVVAVDRDLVLIVLHQNDDFELTAR